MAFRGTILEFRLTRGFGTIEWELPNDRVREITFSCREIQNGGVQDLSPRRQVAFDVVRGRAVRVRVIGVRMFHGTIADYGDDANSWMITEDVTGLCLRMQYDNIFKALPALITPGERVSYTRDPQGREALNIRFPDLAPVSGEITKFFKNGKGFVTPDGWGEAVIFHTAAFVNEPSIHIGMRVKFGLERACPKKLRASGMRAIQATSMRADVPVIQEVEHADVPSQSLQLAASSVNLQSEPIIGDEGVPLDGGDSFSLDGHSLDSVLPLELIHCTFSRDPEPFHAVMQDLMRENDGVRLRSGAYLLAHPFNHVVQDFMEAEAVVTSSKDVILMADLEHIVMTAVKKLPRKFKVNQRRRQPLVPDTWEDLDEEQARWESEYVYEIDIRMIKHTFIHVPVPSSLLSVPSAGPRTESDVTSTARFATDLAANPRRMVRRNLSS